MGSYSYVKLGDISEVITKGTTAKKFLNDGVAFIKIESINSRTTLGNKLSYISEEEHKTYLKRSILKEGDILFSIAGALGIVHIVQKEELPANTNQALSIIRLKQKEKIEYVSWFLETPSIKKMILELKSIGAQPNLSLEQISSIKIPMLSSNKLEQIVVELLNTIEKRIETQNKIIKDNKTFKNQLTEKLIYKNSDVIYIALSNYCCLKNGYSFKSDCYSENGEYSIVTIGNVQGERYLNLEGAKTINTLPNDIQKHQILQKGDILVSLTGNVGRVSIVNKDNCLLNQRVGLLSFIDSKHIEYIFQCLSSPRFEMEMTRKGQGAAQLNLGTNDVASYKIPMRKNNADLVAKLLKKIDEKIILEEQINNLLKKQKQFLLANLFI